LILEGLLLHVLEVLILGDLLSVMLILVDFKRDSAFDTR